MNFTKLGLHKNVIKGKPSFQAGWVHLLHEALICRIAGNIDSVSLGM
jgi:hypothetical protein